MGEELEREAVLPVVVGELEEIAALGRAGIVDEDVEAAVFSRRAVSTSAAAAFGARKSTGCTAVRPFALPWMRHLFERWPGRGR